MLGYGRAFNTLLENKIILPKIETNYFNRMKVRL